MKRPFLSAILAVLIGLTMAACDSAGVPEGPDERPRPVITLTEQQQRLTEADNTFGLKLFRHLSRAEGDANVFISPLSVSMALGMALGGAAGDTRLAMQETLELAGLSMDDIDTSFRDLIDLYTTLDARVQFELANSIWHRDTFPVEADFLARNQTYFDAAVRALDFNSDEAPKTINAWVDEKTHGKIDTIAPDKIDPLTMLFLINAIYFKGDWTYTFDESLTHNAPFTRADGSQATVPMMSLREAGLPYAQHDDYQAVDLPYGDSLFSMTIFLPRENLPLADFVAGLDAQAWAAATAGLALVNLDVLEMPRFKLEYDVSLKEALKALGMEVAFDAAVADFSGINPTQDDLHISEVKHKTFVEVNEEGTEAAAVTAVVIGVESVGHTPLIMRIDRPFVFAIREHATGAILFIGQVGDL